MKNLLIISCFLVMSSCFAQSGKKVTTLNYANNEIEVPNNCVAQSEFELSNCDGFSVQWEHLPNANFKSASRQWLRKFSQGVDSSTPIEVTSYGAVLKGYMFRYKNPGSDNRMVVYGIINEQPLMLSIASKDELIAFAGSNEFLKNLITIPK
ncbi:MAG: hypothetical protein AAF489_00765 [Bacteroidota bacterium]